MNRQELERQAEFALASMSATETPQWLRDLAFERYSDLAWALQWDYSISHGSEAGLLTWPNEYECATEEFLGRLPDEVKARCPVDVLIAIEAAKSIDQHGQSVAFRRECATSLYRRESNDAVALARLRRGCIWPRSPAVTTMTMPKSIWTKNIW